MLALEDVVRTRVGALTYVAPAGALDAPEALAALQATVESCVAARELRIVLDLARVPSLTSDALEKLTATESRLANLGGWLKLANPGPLVRDILVATGLDVRLEPFDATPAATEPEPGRARRLGEILLARALITSERLAEAQRLQRQHGLRLGQILIDRGWVPEADVLKALAEQLGLPYVQLRAGLYDPAVTPVLDADIARRLRILPMFRVNGELTLATTEPQSTPNADEVAHATGCSVRWVLARREDILKCLADAASGNNYAPDLIDADVADLEVVESLIPDDYTAIDELATGSPVVNLVNSIIQRAVRDGASDIHLEITRSKARVRFRIDGLLYEAMSPRPEMYPALISRLKVMANLDIAERRMPQDGRIQVATAGRTVDLRFSSLPGIHGEKVVLRVLDKSKGILDIHKLGMNEAVLAGFKRLLGRTHGLLLVTGPTGSGKTTTLYAAIDHVKSIERNIVTIEDPVEYQLDIINQNQVNDAIGLGFARMLRHVLRQDPDIIMVGEIRDRATAEIAVQAALTGHLVLSTLHTNDSVGAVARLVDMGVEPYLLSSALIGVMAQRLVRRNCPECSTTFLAPPELVERHGWADRGMVRLVRGRGCHACYDSGYKGRLPVHELLEVDAGLQALIVGAASYEALGGYVRDHKMRPLFQDGLDRVLAGLTTVEEITRVVVEA